MKYLRRKLNNVGPLFVLRDLLLVVDEESYHARVYICGRYQTKGAVSTAQLGRRKHASSQIKVSLPQCGEGHTKNARN